MWVTLYFLSGIGYKTKPFAEKRIGILEKGIKETIWLERAQCNSRTICLDE